eukprot:UN27014
MKEQTGEGNDEETKATYTLYRTNNEGITVTNSLSEITQRINKVEAVLGKIPSEGHSYGDMATAITYLEQHLKLLDSDRLERIKVRVEELNSKLAPMKEKPGIKKTKHQNYLRIKQKLLELMDYLIK